MTYARPLFKIAIASIFCLMFAGSCKKSADAPAPVPGPISVGASLDTVSNHLRFNSFTKKSGPIPQSQATTSNLKINFKDTIHLMQGLRIPIQFLHDASTNVAGVYIQVINRSTGASASYYFDVPEFEDDDNDTISTIIVGLDELGLELPLDVDISLAPYDESGEVIEDVEKTLSIEKASDGGGCSFIYPARQGYWKWVSSSVAGSNSANGFSYQFYNAPGKKFDDERTIEGCCNKNGSSGCNNGQLPNRSLKFGTYYFIAEETFRFVDNGIFHRTSLEVAGHPDPEKSNFCAGGYGVVFQSINDIVYAGKWTVDAATKDLKLQHITASQPSGGYGNPGGILRYNCHWMEMTQRTGEGSGRGLVKIYKYVGEDQWWYKLF